MIGWPVTPGYDVYGGALQPFGAMRAPYRGDWAGNRLPDGFPDYLVYVTREALLGSTTSLSRTSTQVHDFFSALNQMLAFDRMLRSFAPWAVPTVYGPWPQLNTRQPWTILPPRQELPLLPYWGNGVPALPKPRSAPMPAVSDSQPDAALLAASYATAMSASAAFLALTPMITDAWRVAL
jgi:hypothetical protein